MKTFSLIGFSLFVSLLVLIESISGQFSLEVNRGKRLSKSSSSSSSSKSLSMMQRRYGLRKSKVSLTLTNIDNIYYYGILYLGEPTKQKFRVNFDTGSADFWVISSKCTTTSCKQHNQYNQAKSKKFSDMKKDFYIFYGDATWAHGRMCTDTLTIGGAKVTAVGFAQATYLFGMEDEINDGIMGLGYQALSSSGFQTPINKAFSQKKIPNKIVSFWLSQNLSNPLGGSLTIGGIDKTRYTGSITYVPVIAKKYWMFNINNISMNNSLGRTINFRNGSLKAIVDTGTTLIWGPANLTNAINEALNATYDATDGLHVFNCSNINLLPSINFSIGNRVFPLTPKEYVFKYYNKCYSVFADGSDDFWIMGAVFIGKYYTIFDGTYHRIGFANAK